jgi:hypothetical protein
MQNAPHGKVAFFRSPMAVQVKNQKNMTILKGYSVIMASGSWTSGGIEVEAIATTNVAKRASVLGVVINGDISELGTGIVRFKGTITDMWVTSTCSKGDWLRLSQTYPGLVVADNSSTINRTRFAIAGEAKATSVRGQIAAELPNWRL